MIKCLITDLEQRCKQRGYEIKEVWPCVVSQDGNEIVVNENHPAYPALKRPPGLGDLVASGLKRAGITPERITQILGKPCGCNERRKKLNALGRKFGIGNHPKGT
jgi:hypothetical protein